MKQSLFALLVLCFVGQAQAQPGPEPAYRDRGFYRYLFTEGESQVAFYGLFHTLIKQPQAAQHLRPFFLEKALRYDSLGLALRYLNQYPPHSWDTLALRIRLLGQQFRRARQLLRSDSPRRHWYALHYHLLQNHWDSAQALAAQKPPQGPAMSDLMAKVRSRRHYSPALALGLSAVVPGLGKAYAGRWQDGALSFFIIASSALQAWMGFNIAGSQSVYAWANAILGGGFYLGNLYGSYQTARYARQDQNRLIHAESRRMLRDMGP